MMRYAIYCRKSTDTEDKQVLSLESQEQELLTLAKKEDIEVTMILKEKMSAKEPGRPIFNNLMALVAQKKIDGILCWKIDRLTRNPIDGGQIQWLLQSGKIQCIKTFEKNYYPSDNVLLINIEQAMATQYIRDLSTNVKRGNRAKLERGEWPNRAPFGYLNDKATKTIIIDRKSAKYILRAFELYASGNCTLKETANILYKEGFRSKIGNKVGKGFIHQILSNSFYCGLMIRDGKTYHGKHKPIVPISLHNCVQDILHGRQHPRPKKHFYAARGFLTCASCGCTLTGDSKKGHTYYYCTNGKGICEQHKKYLRSEVVDELLTTILLDLKFDLTEIALVARAREQTKLNQENTIQPIIDTLKYEANLLADKESVLVDGFSSKIIREEVYIAKMKEIESKQLELTLQIRELEGKKGKSVITFEHVQNLFKQGNTASELYLSGSEEVKRNVLINLLSNVMIENQKVLSYQFKSPFDLLSQTPKNADLRTKLALWDDIGTSLLTSSKCKIIEMKDYKLLREAG